MAHVGSLFLRPLDSDDQVQQRALLLVRMMPFLSNVDFFTSILVTYLENEKKSPKAVTQLIGQLCEELRKQWLAVDEKTVETPAEVSQRSCRTHVPHLLRPGTRAHSIAGECTHARTHAYRIVRSACCRWQARWMCFLAYIRSRWAK